jgi:cation:H+ antiporter
VVGSNIANIGLILGITALILPMAVNRTSVKIDVPFLIFCSLLFYTLAQDSVISHCEGAIFLALIILFTLLSIYKGKKENPVEEPVKEETKKEKELNMISALIMIVASCAALTIGANLLIDSAVSIAKSFGVSERVISITLVAFGTSVPELATSIMAAIRKENDIAIGNVVGSNIFNILFVIGASALITPIENFDFASFSFDFYWMIIFTSILALTVIPFERIVKKIKDEKVYSIITRFEGFCLVAAYIVYVFLLLN